MTWFWNSLALLALVVAAGFAAAAESARAIGRASDLPEIWSGDQHLYVKGDVGVAPDALAHLERWLSNEAPNWTVVILADAGGETYRAADGRSYSGMEAVEYALGQGLPNKTAFGELRDARTGQQNGASFAIFLRERKFSYSGAEAFDSRRLGEANWVGELDRPAFRAMSNGGRVVDAVRGTVSEIEGRLSKSIALEAERRQRAAMAAERRRAEAAAAVEQAKLDVESLAGRAEKFRAANEAAVGDLANPKTLFWNARVESADRLLAAGRAGEAMELATGASEFVRAHSQALVRHPKAAIRFEDLNRAIAELNPDRGGWGAAQLDEARSALARAQVAHSRAESDYEEHFRAAEAAYLSAREEIVRSRAEAKRRLAEERTLLAESERKEKSLRNGAIWGGLVFGAATLGLGALMVRRRRSFKRDAEDALERWGLKFREHTERLFGLLDRANVVVGNEDELAKRGYAGETERLSREVIRDVDGLFIMSSSVERVLADARRQLQPKYAYQKIYNLFGTSRYRRASALLKDLPITFKPGDGVAPLARDDGDQGRPLGRLEEHGAFALTFEELVDQFADRANAAKEKLDTIENAWAEIDGAIESVEVSLDSASDAARRVGEMAMDDGHLALQPVGEALLPAARVHLDRSISLASSDPVGVLGGSLPEARRRVQDAARLGNIVLKTRESRFPAMEQSAKSLREMGRETQWIGRSLEEYSELGERASEEAVEAPAADTIEEFERRLVRLAEDAGEAEVLARRARDATEVQIEEATDSVRVAREELGAGLSLPAGEVLREEGLDPDTRLAEARRQHGAAQLALDRGGVLAADAALFAAEGLAGEACSLVAVSRRSFDEHPGLRERAGEENGHLEDLLPGHREEVATMGENFAPSALLSGAGTAAPDAELSIGDLLRRAEDALAEARQRADEADAGRGRGELIEAASLLELVRDLQAGARDVFHEIRDHRARLDKTLAENENRSIQLGRRREALAVTCEDRRTRRSTIDQFEKVGRQLDAALREAAAAQPDPFAGATQLAGIEDGYDAVESAASNDRELHDEAIRSLGDAASHLAVAKRLGHQASHDQIPDSRRTLELQEEVEKLVLAQMAAERRSRLPHEDWLEVDAEADRLSVAAGRAAAEMRGELERAQRAVASVRSAASAVRDAAGWSGRYGVRVAGSPGANSLHRAREFLLSGRYLETERLADDARRSARHAIAEARNEVARRRRAAEAAAAAARRRRQRSSMFSNSFGSSSSGSSFGSSSSSRGGFSGSSRSSFGGGSGMSRSGW